MHNTQNILSILWPQVHLLMELGRDMKLQVQRKWWRKHERVEGKFVGSCLQWIDERNEWFRGGSSLGRGLEVKRVSSLKDDSQVAIVRSVLNSKCLLHKKFNSEYNAEKLRLLYSSHYTWGILTFGWEGESILAFDASLEKKAWSWPLDDALEKEEAFLTLGCFGSMRCRKKCWVSLSPPWLFW